MKYCIEECHISVNVPNTQIPNGTPLILVAGNGTFEGVKLLVSHQVNPNIPGEKGYLALHEACMRGYTQIVEYFLDVLRFPVDECNNEFGSTPFGLAAELVQFPVLQLLLSRGANINWFFCSYICFFIYLIHLFALKATQRWNDGIILCSTGRTTGISAIFVGKWCKCESLV